MASSGPMRDGYPEPSVLDDYIGPGEAAELLHVSAKTVARWSDEGKIPWPMITLGGHRRWKREVIIQIATNMEGGA